MTEHTPQTQASPDDEALDLRQASPVRAQTSPRAKRRRQRWLTLILIGVLGLVAGSVGYHWWQYWQIHESTDDAYVHGTIALMSARIPGTAAEVLVEDDQPVQQSDILVRLDPTDYRVALERAETAVAVAQARLEAAKLAVSFTREQTAAQVRASRARLASFHQTLQSIEAELAQKRQQAEAAAELEKAQQDLSRAQRLRQRGIIAAAALDQARAASKVAVANYGAARATQRVDEERVAATQQQLQEQQAQITLAETGILSTRMRTFEAAAAQADLQQAKTQAQQARLALSYTEMRALLSGYISKKNVEVGTYVEPGRPLLAIIPLHAIWVEANFKETQLVDIRLGQPVTMQADAYPGQRYQGHVASISAGTGAAFALLPPENATGNWVKVTRRVPVKIVLEHPLPPAYPLRIGMSMHVTVDTHDQHGPRLLTHRW